ncbi:MAG: Vir protein, partial [Actinobacteria bacterium]|nr:Vir protein [Actinomycetota bacterium]
MNYFEPYQQARINIENRFKGLLHAHTTLIKSLITLANPLTGIVTGITYRDIADLLTISKAPGRTESGTPQKETIRSYLRSIEKQCPEDFKVISEGQKLQFQFPKLPEIYAVFLDQSEVYT